DTMPAPKGEESGVARDRRAEIFARQNLPEGLERDARTMRKGEQHACWRRRARLASACVVPGWNRIFAEAEPAGSEKRQFYDLFAALCGHVLYAALPSGTYAFLARVLRTLAA